MTSDKIIKIIKKIVKEEIKLQINSIINEKVEQSLNKILAERYIRNITQEDTVSTSKLVSENIDQSKRTISKQEISEERRRNLLKKMGVEDNPLAAGIFEDVEISSGGTILSSNGIVSEDDDEGIDLSQFGLRKIK
jgi:uncharacterized protein (DUF2344 family)